MFRLSAESIDIRAREGALRDPRAGAFAGFEGWVRNHQHGRRVIRLEYEAYPDLAEREGERIVREAMERFGIYRASCVHRVGVLEIGDAAVWVGAVSAHRDEAFAACRYIIDETKIRVPIWKKEYYEDGDSGWVNCERCSARAPERYARQMVLPQVGEKGQEKLAESRVLVIGAGGLGSPVLLYLAAAGVGRLGICENDRLELSNLHRQILYGDADVGQRKAALAADRLRRLNPRVSVQAHDTRLTPANAEELFRQYDLLIDCTDNFETKFLINDAAVLTGTPAIFSSIYQFEGQLQVVDPEGGTACLRCLWPEMPEPGCVGSCAEVGVLGAVPGIFGSLQAVEALKRIIGMSETLGSEMILLNLLDYSILRVKAKRRADCPVCGVNAAPVLCAPCEGSPLELEWQDALREKDAYLWVDIREPAEVALAPLRCADSVHIPGSAFDPTDSRLDPERAWLLCCARGIRSNRLAQHLRSEGIVNVYSLKGGIQVVT